MPGLEMPAPFELLRLSKAKRVAIAKTHRLLYDPPLQETTMLRHGNGPAPQEGDYYADKDAGVVYLRHMGSWMQLSFHELSAEVRERYADAGVVLDTEFKAVREEDTKTAKAIMAQYLEKDGSDYKTAPMTTSQTIGEVDDITPDEEDVGNS